MEGLAQLTDLAFLWAVDLNRNQDPFTYEMDLLDNWARRVLRPIGENS